MAPDSDITAQQIEYRGAVIGHIVIFTAVASLIVGLSHQYEPRRLVLVFIVTVALLFWSIVRLFPRDRLLIGPLGFVLQERTFYLNVAWEDVEAIRYCMTVKVWLLNGSSVEIAYKYVGGGSQKLGKRFLVYCESAGRVVIFEKDRERTYRDLRLAAYCLCLGLSFGFLVAQAMIQLTPIKAMGGML